MSPLYIFILIIVSLKEIKAVILKRNLSIFFKLQSVQKIRVSSVWPPGLNAFESIVIYDRNAQLFQSFLGQLKKILHQTVFFVPFE